MLDTSTYHHHSVLESITDVIATQVRNDDKAFFRPLVAHALCVIASSMRAKVMTAHRGEIPVNGYIAALAPSGAGKGAAVTILEEVTREFRKIFKDYTMPLLAEANLRKLAIHRAVRSGKDEEFEYNILLRDYQDAGAFAYTFTKPTEAAIKQVREKLLLAGCGALNLVVDEIGSNLTGSTEGLNVYLELYDQGLVKRNLRLSGPDKKRTEEIEGKTPANALVFGTPTKLLDAGTIEREFYSFLETGYARRFLFAMGHPQLKDKLSAKEAYELLKDPSLGIQLLTWANHFASLADPVKLDWEIDVPDPVGLEMMEYQLHCEELARLMKPEETLRRAEMTHRYYKTIKLAGAFAFIEESMTMDIHHFRSAVKLVEESGDAFNDILRREKPYIKLAKYLAASEAPLTHADLAEALSFYESTDAKRKDLMNMATSWGYKNNILIKKRFIDNIEIFDGETLKNTDLDAVSLSVSEDFAFHYEPVTAKFSDLHELAQMDGMNWTTHSFRNEHRSGDNVIPGFNMIVLDIDHGISLANAHDIMSDYTFMTYTTKRHTPDSNRFRMVLPMNYELALTKEDYKLFMKNVISWLPFEVDEDAACDQVRKWATYPKTNCFHHTGKLLVDVLPFIPQTSRNDNYRKEVSALKSLDSLERWFSHRFVDGQRNQEMIKFALILVDSGMNYQQVEDRVLAFNAKLSNKLDVTELHKTVLVTVARKLQTMV